MKNKSLTYLLLIVVAVIWYQVFFRIKSNLETDLGSQQEANQNTLQQIAIVRDTFVLDANYRDPFGGKIAYEKQIDSTAPKKKIVQEVKPKQSENWYSIKYYGLIKQTNSKNPLAILKIDGVQFSLRVGDEAFDGYKVKAIYKDSILIKFKNSSKYFYKN